MTELIGGPHWFGSDAPGQIYTTLYKSDSYKHMENELKTLKEELSDMKTMAKVARETQVQIDTLKLENEHLRGENESLHKLVDTMITCAEKKNVEVKFGVKKTDLNDPYDYTGNSYFT